MSDFSCIFPLQKGCPTTSLFFLPDVGGSVFYSRKLTEALGKEPSLYGFRLDPEFDWSQPERTFIKLAEQFADNLINSDIPEPYHLIGHSFAGLLAFETARQLKIKGGNVGLVALLDTPVPEHMRINSKIEKLTYVLRMIANIAYWVWHKILSEGLLQTVKFFIGKTAEFIRPHGVENTNISKKKTNRLTASGYATIDLTHQPESYRIIIGNLYKAMTFYQPLLYEGDLVVFKSRVQEFSEANPSHMGWRPYVEGKVNTHIVGGQHLDIIHKNTEVFSVAFILTDLLQKTALDTQKKQYQDR